MKWAALAALASFAGIGYYLYKRSDLAQIGLSADVGTNPEPITTPSGATVDLTQKTWEFCNAIARAEGFGIPGTAPTIYHNPGDLGPGDTGYPGDVHSGSVISHLPDDKTGWDFLYRKVHNIFTGQSRVYSTAMTITEMAQKYAADWQNWANNVAAYLGVSPSTVIADWLSQP